MGSISGTVSCIEITRFAIGEFDSVDELEAWVEGVVHKLRIVRFMDIKPHDGRYLVYIVYS